MRLYHGTNGAWVDSILKRGLVPRGSGKVSNWHHTIVSNPKCVYLTDSYAPYFAFNAARGREPSCAVIEIDTDRLDPSKLYPDEDFLEQASRQIPDAIPGSMRQRTLHYRRHQFGYDWPCDDPDTKELTTWWQASLKYLGTCAHRGPIPASAITRIVTWPHTGQNVALMFTWDCSICIINQQILGNTYRMLTAKLFKGDFAVEHEDDTHSSKVYMTDPDLQPLTDWRLIEVS